MPYVLVDEMRSSIATVSSPTGQIIMPSIQSAIVGQELSFTFKGKNTSSVGQTMLINFYLFRPDNIVAKFGEKGGSLAAGSIMLLETSHEFTMAGVWYADCRLFAWY